MPFRRNIIKNGHLPDANRRGEVGIVWSNFDSTYIIVYDMKWSNLVEIACVSEENWMR